MANGRMRTIVVAPTSRGWMLGRHLMAAVVAAFGIGAATAALADPCEAISADGRAPGYLTYGATFRGEVVEVIDGDSLCIAVGPTPREWVEVRIADFYVPELSSPTGPAAKATLRHIAAGKQAVCVAGFTTYDRIAARCTIDGRSIGDSMRASGVSEGGNGHRAGAPAQAMVRPRTPSPTRSAAPAGLTCAEYRARGGVRRGEPGYRASWDGDSDGIACEPYRGR